MSTRQGNLNQMERQRWRPVPAHQRVRALLACRMLSPWIRRATIRSLVDDPETRAITIALADPAELNSELEISNSQFQ